jgi:hypothetical protein
VKSESRACEHFDLELQRLVRRFRAEYEMSYAEAIGCLTLAAARITEEALGAESDDDDAEAGFP